MPEALASCRNRPASSRNGLYFIEQLSYVTSQYEHEHQAPGARQYQRLLALQNDALVLNIAIPDFQSGCRIGLQSVNRVS
jgi:hypothetical protein